MPRTYILWSTTPGSSGVVSSTRQRVLPEVGEHLEMVLGVAPPVLLEAFLADARVGRHQNPGARALHARPPRALAARHLAALVELGGVLAEVPDVALRVLGVPVVRLLLEVAVEPQAVVDDHALHAGDLDRPVGDRHHLARALAVLDPLVDDTRCPGSAGTTGWSIFVREPRRRRCGRWPSRQSSRAVVSTSRVFVIASSFGGHVRDGTEAT